MLATTINGLFPPDFKADGRINLTELMAGGGGQQISNPPVTILDARPLQSGAESESAFLAEHGFVLLTAPTAVRDWNCDQSVPGNDISQLYLPQVEEIIRTKLLPGRKIDVQHFGPVGRRGPGTANPNYANGAHQDYGLTVDDFEHDVAVFTSQEVGRKWRERYERDDVEGYMVLDFWRTAGMAGPLEHMPLALCDPTSVDPADIIETALQGIAPSGAATHHLSLRRSPTQRWYYYPRMTPDEAGLQAVPGDARRCRAPPGELRPHRRHRSRHAARRGRAAKLRTPGGGGAAQGLRVAQSFFSSLSRASSSAS